MVRYLTSKQKLDDRSLNNHVIHSLVTWLKRQPRSLRVLEVGAGVGTMLSRLASWGRLTHAHYTLLDTDAHSLAAAREHLAAWAAGRALSVAHSGPNSSALHINGTDAKLTVEFVQGDALDFSVDAPELRFDLIVASSVLDLMELNQALAILWQVCAKDAAYWFTLNFDGETIFLPPHAHDKLVVAEYHATMDRRTRNGHAAGHSQTGRRLLQALVESDATLLEAGSSDWMLFPKAGAYDGDERYFLTHILHFVETAVGASGNVPAEALRAWLQARRDALSAGKLTYIAKQLDVFGLAPTGSRAKLG